MHLHRMFSCILLVLIFFFASLACGKMVPVDLQCEYKVQPLGLDETAPRLSWKLMETDADAKDKKQSAYQILVSDSLETLKDSGNLWDTGKVLSDKTNQIEYAGTALKSGMQCWWKVRAWDEEGAVGDWSEPRCWTMGILDDAQWKAAWIGYDEPPVLENPSGETSLEQLTFDRCQWIWSTGRKAKEEAPAGSVYFRKIISIPEGDEVQGAGMLLTADDRFVLYVNGQEAGRSDDQKDAWRRPQRINLSELLTPGENLFAIKATNDIPSPAGVVGKIVIQLKSGETFTESLDTSWKMTSEEVEGWKGTGVDTSGWKNARKVCDMGKPPWNIPGSGDSLFLPPPPYLRKEFQARGEIKNGYIYASALGVYELRLNGHRVGESFFTPGWSDYNKRVYYNTYEVTDLLLDGDNAIGAILADGWYAGYLGWGQIRERYGDKPRFMAQLHVEYEDGTREIIVTDSTWKASYGPIFEADLLMGEGYDARRESGDWDQPGYDDSSWNSVVAADKIKPLVQAYPGVTVQKMEHLKTQSVSKVGEAWIFDLGQNMVGWARLKAAAPAGTEIKLRFGERLNPDGSLYTTNLRGARATDTYIFKGDEVEVWEPKFSFHGFRYVEMTSYPGEPNEDTITGIVLHSNTPRTGDFECSSDLVNQLFHNILWGQKGNYFEVPTDCPQRDERLGWTGDAQVFINTAAYNMDIAAFFTKWMVDLEDSQLENGAFAHVAPNLGLDGGSPAWSDAGIICPYAIYQFYGDTRIIEKHYDAMVRYMEYLNNNSEGFRRPEMGYGDWLSLNAHTPKELIGTAYYAYVARLMGEMSTIIGKQNEAQKYYELSDKITEVFREAYVNEKGVVTGDTQTAYALALSMDLLKKDTRSEAASRLVKKIEERDWHVSTGFVGLPLLLPTLTRFEHNDIAHRLLLNETYPSWGYEIAQGATTIWERWDGWTEDGGFQNPGMNSFNHYAYGAVGEWIYSTLGGISQIQPAFKEILIAPRPERVLEYAETTYDSINGTIETQWWNSPHEFKLRVKIPVNTSAKVVLPFDDGHEHRIGSGEYEFHIKRPAEE